VLNHYEKGMIDSPYLDPIFKQHNPAGISLSENDKSVVKAFLHTLTDQEFLQRRILAEY
jgi:cytochrome c peroxidase